MMKNLLLLLTLCGILLGQGLAQMASTSDAEKAGMSVERLARYSSYLTKEVEDGKIPGAVSLVMRKGEVVHQGTFGYNNLEEKAEMVQDQIFYIQSMTKPLVSVAIMMLYEEGHFFLNDPVSKYLPNFNDLKVSKDPEAGKDGETEPTKGNITIAQLLSHTAGFSHGLGPNKLEEDIRTALYFSPQENIESRVNTLVSLPMIGHPGEQWYYSASPDVLSLLIEHFSGMNTAEFLQERLFDPLGMEDTGYNLDEAQEKRMVTLYYWDQERKLVKSPRQTPVRGNKVYGGTHGMFSTAGDYMKFCQMLLNGGSYNGHQLLSPKTIALMTENHVGDLRHFEALGHGFGLGFGVKTDLSDSKSLGSVGQYYWSGAYNTYFFIDPTEELVAVLMTQTAQYTNFYANKMRQFVYQAIVE